MIDLRNQLYSIISGYFEHATVVWGKTNSTKGELPLVFLELGQVTRPRQPEVRWAGSSLGQAYYYQSSVRLTVNLCTKGKVHVSNSATNFYENTAESDLLQFVDYICSEEAIEWCDRHGFSIQSEGMVISPINEHKRKLFEDIKSPTRNRKKRSRGRQIDLTAYFDKI